MWLIFCFVACYGFITSGPRERKNAQETGLVDTASSYDSTDKGGTDDTATGETGHSDTSGPQETDTPSDTDSPHTGDTTRETGGDTSVAETGETASDTSFADTGAADTSEDSDSVADTSVAETGTAETGETGEVDTSSADTGAADTSATETGETGESDSGSAPTDEDDDGYDSLEDCDDLDASAHPGGHEASIDTATDTVVDGCDDGIDEDCDGLVDDKDWDCQDADGDGVVNAIDVLVPSDRTGDRADDTLCVVAIPSLAFSETWSAFDTVLQGDPAAWGGGFDSLDRSTDADGDGVADTSVLLEPYADSDGDGIDDANAWCVSSDAAAFLRLSTGAWNWRLVSDVAADGTTAADVSCDDSDDATTWVPIDLASFCAATSDDYCRTGYSARDGCGDRIGTLIRFDYDADSATISPH